MDFELESITPMFMAGYDGRTPELRPPSFKGLMRFWWRTMNGHLALDELRNKEADIFGDSGEHGKSKILIRLNNIRQIKTESISLTPHHREGYCSKDNHNCDYRNGKCMKSNLQRGCFYEFTFSFDYHGEKKQETIEFLSSLMKLMFILGGFGKRSRRGFGSLKIRKADHNEFLFDYSIDSMLNLLNSFQSNQFIIDGSRIVRSQTGHASANYPYIKEIEIGKTVTDYKDILIKIGESSHRYKNNSLGFASKGKRFASPVYGDYQNGHPGNHWEKSNIFCSKSIFKNCRIRVSQGVQRKTETLKFYTSTPRFFTNILGCNRN